MTARRPSTAMLAAVIVVVFIAVAAGVFLHRSRSTTSTVAPAVTPSVNPIEVPLPLTSPASPRENPSSAKASVGPGGTLASIPPDPSPSGTTAPSLVARPPRSSQTSNTSTDPRFPVSSDVLAQLSTPINGHCITQGRGITPVWQDGVLRSVLEADSLASGTSRSEIYWQKTPTQRLHLQEGDRVVLTETIQLHLGTQAQSRGQDNQSWAVITQQHGPFGSPSNPTWGNPEGALVVVNGVWKFTAGDRTRGNNWEADLAPYVDDATTHWVIDIKESATTNGWVRMWMNGKQVLNTTKPVLQPDSYEGVEIRSGLYMGTNGGSLPTIQRTGTYTNLRLAYFPGPNARTIKYAGVVASCERI